MAEAHGVSGSAQNRSRVQSQQLDLMSPAEG